jgi:hypothetical protein
MFREKFMYLDDEINREDKGKLREEIKIKRKEYLERKRRSELKKVVDNLNEECDALVQK